MEERVERFATGDVSLRCVRKPKSGFVIQSLTKPTIGLVWTLVCGKIPNAPGSIRYCKLYYRLKASAGSIVRYMSARQECLL